MKKIVLVLILFLFPTAVGWADELVLIKGKGVEVCEAHYKNLQPLSLNEMVCQRDESYPEANGITRPKWEDVDLKENKELVKRIEKFFSYGDQFRKDKMFDDEKEFEQYLTGALRSNLIKISTIDIANSGKPEKVLLYSDRPCDVIENIAWNRGPYSRPLFVLDEEKNQIDVKKTEPLMQNPFGKDLKSKAQGHLYQLYEMFFYKSKAYFDKWNMRDRALSVYNQSKGKVKEICKYQYEQKN